MTAHDDAIGLWQLKATEPAPECTGRDVTNHYTFRYDGDTVTVRLLTMHPGMWKSEDDFYRLEARWDGDMLSYRPPFGDWAEVAAFVGDHFEDNGNGIRRVFARISDAEVIDFNRAILAPRPAHDYSVQPSDPV